MIEKDVKKFIKKCNAAYCNGSPFDTLREDEIKTLRQIGRLFVVARSKLIHDAATFGDLRADELQGVIVAQELDSDRLVRDFAQRRYKLPAGSLYVKGYYFDDFEADHFKTAIYDLSEYFQNSQISVQIYPECSPEVDWFEAIGFKRALTKVSAFAEVKAIYTNTNIKAFESLFETADDATLEVIDEKFIYDTMREVIFFELRAALSVAQFANHYSIYNKDDKWSGLTIRGFDVNDPGFIEKPTEMSKAWKAENPKLLNRKCQDTIIAPHFSTTLAYLCSHLSDRLERVRILRLDAGGRILRHCDIQDKDAGTADGKIVRFHIPLKTNDTEFTSWDAEGKQIKLKMPLNSLCYLDHRKPHAVTNSGDTDRLHLVVDVYSDTSIRLLLQNAHRRNYARPI